MATVESGMAPITSEAIGRRWPGSPPGTGLLGSDRTGRYARPRRMTSVPEISVVQVPSTTDDGGDAVRVGPTVATWGPVELPPTSRPSPIWLAVLALLAGIGAMVLGGLAVVSATRSDDSAPAVRAAAPPPESKATSETERRVLALLAKPSTQRVAFSGSGGRLVLAVGSGGKAAILIRGYGRATAARPHVAWVVRSGRAARAARFTGAERAVFLSAVVRPGTSVIIAADRAAALRPSARRVAAARP